MFKRVFLQISVGIAFGAATLTAQAADITGAGASFPYPIYAKWAAQYQKDTGNRVNYQSIGSGGGQQQIIAKTVDFGASDVPAKEAEVQQLKDKYGDFVYVASAIGGIAAAAEEKCERKHSGRKR